MTKGHTAVHAASALDLDLFLGEWNAELLPVPDAFIDWFVGRIFSSKFHETGNFTHFDTSFDCSHFNGNSGKRAFVITGHYFNKLAQLHIPGGKNLLSEIRELLKQKGFKTHVGRESRESILGVYLLFAFNKG